MAQAATSEARRLAKTRSVLLHIVHRKKSLAFRGWYELARAAEEQEKRRKGTMRSVTLKMLKSYLTMAWNSFRAAVTQMESPIMLPMSEGNSGPRKMAVSA